MLSPPLVFFVFLFGLVFGSFGNVLIFRLPEGKGVGGRSKCPKCGRTLGIVDLVPVISFVLLRAKCRTCRERISWQYPLVELVSGLLFVFALWQEPSSLFHVILLAACLWFLLIIALTDARTGMIPDALNLPFLLIALFRAHELGMMALLPAAVGGGVFAVQWIVSRGKWVGSGDIILAAGLGAFLGSIQLLLLSLWFAYVGGAIVAVILLVRGRKKLESRLAFGPFLIVGAAIAFVCGQVILERVIGL